MKAYQDQRCQEITVIIADDDALAREGLKSVLQLDSVFNVIAETDSRDVLVLLVEARMPDIVVIDAGLLSAFGLQTLDDLAKASPQTKIVLIGIHASPELIIRSLQIGARGYIPKSASVDRFWEALRQVAEGMSPVLPEMASDLLWYVLAQRPKSRGPTGAVSLTRRQYEVLQYMVQGLCNKEIAALLHVSETTVKSHVTGILRRLGVSDRTQAVVKALRERIVVLEDADAGENARDETG